MSAFRKPAVVCSLTILVICAAAPALAAPGDVRTSFDAPCKYPAGIASDGGSLYVLDWREAKIHPVSGATGEAQNVWSAPTLKPHGMTFGDGLLFISDDHTGYISAFNPTTGVVEYGFEGPGSRVTGLAHAGDALFLLEGKSRQIYKVVPTDGTILAYFPVPDRSCTCLAYDGKYLWVSNRVADELYMVDPESGAVLGILDAPGPYAAGLTWLDGHLWTADFQTRKLYQLVVRDEQKYRLSETRRARVEYYWALCNYGPGEVQDLVVNLAIPQEMPSQQLLSEIRYSVSPTKSVTDRWDQPCAVFELGGVPAAARQPLAYSVDVEVSAIRYLIDPDETGTLDDIPAKIRQDYTADGLRYRISSDYIQETVRKVVGDEKNPYWIARKIYNLVIDRLEYEMVGGWDVPEVVLKRGSGSCSEYTFAFIALCRAAGLPARYRGSIVVRGDDASVDEAFHRWAEIYLPNYGWIPVDANRGDAKTPADQARGFGNLANRFLITTQGGGDSALLEWGYNAIVKYKTTGYCNVKEENFGFWEPLDDEEQSAKSANLGQPATCQPR